MNAVRSSPLWSCGCRCFNFLYDYASKSGPVWSCGRRRYIDEGICSNQIGPVWSCGRRHKTPEWGALREGQRKIWETIQACEQVTLRCSQVCFATSSMASTSAPRAIAGTTPPCLDLMGLPRRGALVPKMVARGTLQPQDALRHIHCRNPVTNRAPRSSTRL